ncbi:two-component system, chemotaxis family, CheB/CheR fusion protein [Alteromonadaceae bacterium Bs31]|nr:two-component system, chemotaxis family, CheB/CheR fusion protein [Alteromonadaceae bacterium Bs31]
MVVKKRVKKSTSASKGGASAVASSGQVPIVGIGASAGGLEAFETFFRVCPEGTGMAFVLVPHLDPGHESLLAEILQRSTSMKVTQAQDMMALEANCVFIIPPNREMTLVKGTLRLFLPEAAPGHRLPIDIFFKSLAADQGEKAIGIVLSGTATDGTLGLSAILAAGGACIVQDPTGAKYDGMPQSAISSGFATHILQVDGMPAELIRLVNETGSAYKRPAISTEKYSDGIDEVLVALRASSGHDFSQYKKSTIGRRIARRMSLHGIDNEGIYARLLKENPLEVKLLFKELLINVTSFFRDPEAFVELSKNIFPRLFKDKPPGYVFRVWVAGCSTGEEAYSIAILLSELQDTGRQLRDLGITFQVFATDLDDEAITVARSGCYPAHIAEDISPERLERFFSKADEGYKVKKELRDMVVFAVQNVIKDPPFTKLDFLSCRNLMIYLESGLQNCLISTFHYALNPMGVLFLSTSESINNPPGLFLALDRKWKFYQALHASERGWPRISIKRDIFNPHTTLNAASRSSEVNMSNNRVKPLSIADISHRVLLQSFAPASVTIDSAGNILYIHGDTGHYLRPAPGPVSNNVFEMAREGLQQALRSAVQRATSNAEPAFSEKVSVKTNGGFSLVQFAIQRLVEAPSGDNLLLISFKNLENPHSGDAALESVVGVNALAQDSEPGTADAGRIKALELQLAYAEETLKTQNEEQQAFYEELKSTNEELQSTNEELQSANEELETSKEELQSLNEETITVNAELNARIVQLTGIQNDMKNLLDSVGTATLFLDHQLCIRRHTPAAAKIYRLIATDDGRPLSDIASNLDLDQQKLLFKDLQKVLDTLIPIEREVQTADGEWFLARIQPYRTLDNVIEGVVLTFTSITSFKHASESAQLARDKLAQTERAVTQTALELAEGIIDMVHEPLIVLDKTLLIVSANQAFFKAFNLAALDVVGRKIDEFASKHWSISSLKALLAKVLSEDQAAEAVPVEHKHPAVGECNSLLSARRIVTAAGKTELILFSIVKP